MNHAEQQIRKLAAELYDQTLDDGQTCSIEDIVQQLIDDLVRRYSDEDRSAIRELVEISAREAVAYVDKRRTRPEEQPTLSDDMDRAIKVGDGLRRSRRTMTNAEWARHLSYVNDNRARVNLSADRENLRYAALGPYLVAGMNTEAALAAWQSDHAEQVLS